MLSDKLIHIVNDVHDALSTIDIRSQIDLPQIAVVGSQSTGKTSVLESLVGRDFLPRGTGIVTRCPLVLKLRNTPEKTPEYGEFTHKPDQRYDDFAAISQEIENRTGQLVGTKTVSLQEISLTVYSPHVLNLTLVDLPGLVVTAVKDQDPQIVKDIRDMVNKFIAPENTIILAISSATDDLANSAALQAAKKVDPQGMRTLGVLTKLDRMEQGTNAADVLENSVYRLRKGWIGVVNRSQVHIREGRSMQEARAAERAFFENHPDYARIAHKNGTQVLAQTLSAMLLQHIQKGMPELRRRVDDLVQQTRRRQEDLGMLDENFTDPASKMQRLLHEYQDLVRRCIAGEASPPNAKPGELKGGARIDEIFHRRFGDYISQMRAASRLSDDEIREVTRNCAGVEGSLFPSDKGFRALARRQVKLLENPSLKCIEIVHEELRSLATQCADRLKQHPKLQQTVIECVCEAIDGFRVPCVAHVRTMIEAEEGFINVKHPKLQELIVSHFEHIPNAAANAQMPIDHQMGQPPSNQPQHQPPQQGGGAQQPGGAQPQNHQQQGGHPGAANLVRNATDAHAQAVASRYATLAAQGRADFHGAFTIEGTLTPHEAVEHARLRELIEAYFTIVKGTVADQVPKIIHLLLIEKLIHNLGQVLLRKFSQPKEFEDLLAEAPHIAQMRKATTKMMDALMKAKNALDRVRDLPPDAAAAAN